MNAALKLIALDLDGTLLNRRHSVSPANAAAIHQARAAGLAVLLATGKTRNSALEILAQLELDTPGIFVQGLVTHNGDGSVRRQCTLAAGLTREILILAEDFTLLAYRGTQIYASRADRNRALVAEYGEPLPPVCDSLSSLLADGAFNKLVAVDCERPTTRARLERALGAAARVIQVGVPGMVEVLPPGASKAEALKELLQDLQLDARQVLAIGDGENDIDMLRLAGVGVAMANAAGPVRAAADFVTASNEQDGVARAIHRCLPQLAQHNGGSAG